MQSFLVAVFALLASSAAGQIGASVVLVSDSFSCGHNPVIWQSPANDATAPPHVMFSNTGTCNLVVRGLDDQLNVTKEVKVHTGRKNYCFKTPHETIQVAVICELGCPGNRGSYTYYYTECLTADEEAETPVEE